MKYTAKLMAGACAIGLMLGGCSSKPRRFVPALAAPPTDQAAFENAYATCRQLLIDQKLDSNGKLASGATGVAAGATTLVLGGAAASSAGLYGGMAVLGATVVALPFVALAGAIGMAKAKRHKKEKVIDRVLAGCMKERGYDVSKWVRAPKPPKATVPRKAT